MTTSETPKNDFGVPEVDSTPIGIVNMEGRLFRGISDTKKKSLSARIGGLLFSALFLMIGLGFLIALYVSWSDLIHDENWLGIGQAAILVLLLISAGMIGIRANLKK